DAGIEVVAEAGDGHEAVDAVRSHRPDVVLLDIQMPKLDGLGALEEIRRTTDDVAAIVLTTFGEDAYIARALSAGANGFLLKAGDPRELIAAVRGVTDGAAFLSPQVAARVVAQFNGTATMRGTEARDRIAVLSERERDVLVLIGEGLSNAEIARRLHLVEGTVKSYVSTVLSRLEAKNRVQLAILAYEAGLVGRD